MFMSVLVTCFWRAGWTDSSPGTAHSRDDHSFHTIFYHHVELQILFHFSSSWKQTGEWPRSPLQEAVAFSPTDPRVQDLNSSLQHLTPNTVNRSVWLFRSIKQWKIAGFSLSQCMLTCTIHIHIHRFCHVLISALRSRCWHITLWSRDAFAVTTVITIAERALSCLKLRGNPPRLHRLL